MPPPSAHGSPFAPWLLRLLPFLRWPRLTASLLKADLFAGATVGLFVVPQAVAYAALAGMPLVTGIYASLLPALVATLWGASPRISAGPTALTALLVGASLTGLAAPGSPQWVVLAVWLALLAGVLQLAMGVLKMGWLLNLVSAPVMTGFTQAAAWLILASLLPTMLGMDAPLTAFLHGGVEADLLAAAFGCGTLAMLMATRRWAPRFPSVALIVLGSSGASWLAGFANGGGAVVGQLPTGLPGLHWPEAPTPAMLGQLVLPALVIALISFLEVATSARLDHQQAGTRWDEDQDLIGHGLGKLVAGLSGAFVTSSSFSRSALNRYTGAKSGWASVISVGVVLLALAFFTPLLFHVPQSVLAAVVVAAVIPMVQPLVFLRYWRVSRVEGLTGLVTFALTLLTAPRLYWGVVAGLLASLSHFLYHRLHPRIVEVGLHADGSLRDRELWNLPPLAPALYALRMDADLDFAAASSLERRVAEHIADHPDTRAVALFAQAFNRTDSTGVEAFMRLRDMLGEHRIALHISGLKLPVENVLRRAGALPAQEHALLRLYRTDAEALAALAGPATESPPP